MEEALDLSSDRILIDDEFGPHLLNCIQLNFYLQYEHFRYEQCIYVSPVDNLVGTVTSLEAGQIHGKGKRMFSFAKLLGPTSLVPGLLIYVTVAGV